MSLHSLRLTKAAYAVAHPWCWPALLRGVAPSLEHQEVLKGLDIDRLLDVGANRGQFSLMTRRLKGRIPIQAYEPQPAEADVYSSLFTNDPRVALHRVALADRAGSAMLHVSARPDSSSLLPIGMLQEKLFKGTAEVGVLSVPTVTLDSLESHWSDSSRALLKLDVQGFELQVLQGAREALKRCAYVYVECSEVALYDGQALHHEVASFLESNGFRAVGRYNEFVDHGDLIQADFLFAS